MKKDVRLQLSLPQEKVAELKRRYHAENAADALVKLLLGAAGLWIFHELITEKKPPKKRRKA